MEAPLASPVDQTRPAWLPVGRALPERVWESRHRGITWLLAAHVPFLFVVGVATHHTPTSTALCLIPIGMATWFARRTWFGRAVRASLATIGLVYCSALLVHFSGGTIEMHFHFFVVVGVITLYQEWLPFVVALGFVVAEHGVVGVLAPESVYNHHHAQTQPWVWAGIHGAFVLAASVPHVLAWRMNENQALRDPLTGMSNRMLLGDRLTKALERRRGGRQDLAVLFIDLDNFKHVNDTLGHAVGDELLVTCAQRLLGCVRDAEVAGRLGGDEFAVIIAGPAAANAEKVARRILHAVGEPTSLSGHELVVTASIGIAYASQDASPEDLLRQADLAMYYAKAAGRDRFVVFEDEMHDLAIEHLLLEADLRHAVAADAITVAYEPIIAIDTGLMRGVEVLARWDHPTRGPVPPVEFIPIAERSLLIGALGERVLEQACATATRLHVLDPNLDITFNVSPVQLRDPELPETFAEIFRRHGVDASRFVMEVTENALMSDLTGAAERLAELKSIGVRIAIDDFGVGHSSLSYLRHLPVDVLKIDKSFVDGLPANGTALARAMIQLGQVLGLDVIAEGIELPSQLEELRLLGCQRGQGYLFSRPMTAEHLLAQVATSVRPWADGADTPAEALAPPK